MAVYELDELESDEIFHALQGRKMDLDKRVKDLEEKDGLPEAAQAVRGRVEIYMPHGSGKKARPGLLRLFAPQRDLEAEATAARADQERAPDGSQDMFGGGAETGGGIPAGQTQTLDEHGKPEPAKKKGRKGKKGAAAESDAPAEPASNDRTPADAEYEIVDESRWLGSGDESADDAPTDGDEPIRAMIAELDTIGDELLAGPSSLADADYDQRAARVLEIVTAIHPTADPAYVEAQINQEFRGADDSAVSLGSFAKRSADQIRDALERPIGRREDAHQLDGQEILIDINVDAGHATEATAPE